MISVVETRMSKVAEKLRNVEVELSNQKGDFTLFALVEREDSLGKWDVVASADWIQDQKKTLIDSIASKISKALTREEQLMLSRIIILPPSDPFVRNLNLISVNHGTVKLSNNVFNGILIKEAYLITSNPQ